MARQTLTDGSGVWFDTKAAVCFGEETRWDGRNHISVATGSQWEHEDLYYTKSGKWVLHHWSQWQGSAPSWAEVTEAEAVRWLSVNSPHGNIGEMPDAIFEAVQAGLAALEL